MHLAQVALYMVRDLVLFLGILGQPFNDLEQSG